MLTKICNLIELFGYNMINLSLIEKYNIHNNIFNGFIVFYKVFARLQTQSKDRANENREFKRMFTIAFIKCLMTCLRSNNNILSFINVKQKNFKRVVDLIRDKELIKD